MEERRVYAATRTKPSPSGSTCSSSSLLRSKKPATAQAAPFVRNEEKTVNSAARLPVKRVMLCKNGIGYFEHTTRVPDKTTATY
jgi:hypothetical protein